MEEVDGVLYEGVFTWDMHQWKRGAFTKITLKVDNAGNIFDFKDLADHLKIPNALVKDNGDTQANGDNGITLAIGPFDTENEQYKEMMTHISKFKLY
jgi:peptidyl-tRNA hydrolase